MCFHVILGNSPLPDIVGAVVGHALLFLFDILPAAHPIWRTLSTPPKWLERQVNTYAAGAGYRVGAGGAYAAVPIRRPPPGTTSVSSSHRWGSGGRKLGDS